MPIRFRCVYCDKLLGIARRKAGAVVNCPQCGQPLIVPTPEPEPEPTAARPAHHLSPASYSSATTSTNAPGRGDIRAPDDSRRRKRSKTSPVPAPLPPKPFPVERSLPPPPHSTQEAIPAAAAGRHRPHDREHLLLVIVMLVLMGLAFGGGIVVGRTVLAP